MLLEQLSLNLQLFVLQTQINAKTLGIITAIPWAVFLLNTLLGNRLLFLGIRPRLAIGLPGIFFAPLLHAGFNHIFFNTIPFVILSDFILINGLGYYLTVTVCITLISGVLVWLLCNKGLYVGASALITGYWAFLVLDIYQQGTFTAIILGIVCLYYFAGVLLSLFPQQKGVSWQGHICGFIAGITTSFLINYEWVVIPGLIA